MGGLDGLGVGLIVLTSVVLFNSLLNKLLVGLWCFIVLVVTLPVFGFLFS